MMNAKPLTFRSTATTPTATSTLSLHDALPIFRGVNDGPREVAWDGLLADRHLAPPGRYELRVTGNRDRKSTRLNSSHVAISYAVFCLKKKTRGAEHDLVVASALVTRACMAQTW